MDTLAYKRFSRRHLPHLQPPEATLFVSYRLAGSIPEAMLREYKAKTQWFENERERVQRFAQKRPARGIEAQLDQAERFRRKWSVKFEQALDDAQTGPTFLKDDRIAGIVANQLHELDGDSYRLDAYCVMSNHVHAVFTPFLTLLSLRETFDARGHLAFVSHFPGLSKIMHQLKGRTAQDCNLALSRKGQFWEHESFDHVIRPGKLLGTVRYVLENPVKAGLVDDWRKWRWGYCRKELGKKLL